MQNTDIYIYIYVYEKKLDFERHKYYILWY